MTMVTLRRPQAHTPVPKCQLIWTWLTEVGEVCTELGRTKQEAAGSKQLPPSGSRAVRELEGTWPAAVAAGSSVRREGGADNGCGDKNYLKLARCRVCRTSEVWASEGELSSV
jgi:hypothetical protein